LFEDLPIQEIQIVGDVPRPQINPTMVCPTKSLPANHERISGPVRLAASLLPGLDGSKRFQR
jgi:hypothetical protein